MTMRTMKAMKYISAALLTALVAVAAGCSADRELPELTGNPTTATMLEDMIDYSAKPMLYGEKTLQESGRELYDLILRVANGEETKAEKLGDYSWTTPHGTSYNGDY